MRLGLVQGKAVEKAIVELTLSERNESKGLDFNFNNTWPCSRQSVEKGLSRIDPEREKRVEGSLV